MRAAEKMTSAVMRTRLYSTSTLVMCALYAKKELYFLKVGGKKDE